MVVSAVRCEPVSLLLANIRVIFGKNREPAAENVKKLKEDLQRRLSDEQIAQYVSKLESEIGTTINENAVALATGAANSNN